MAGISWFSGCPMWANKAWLGSLFPRATRPPDYLAQYARVFSSVEGNTTFYGVPQPATVARWLAATPPGFRFTFKFPRLISHEKALRETDAEVSRFLETLQPLGQRLGPIFLQLPPTFGDLFCLEQFLLRLPSGFNFAVEARHPAFFADLEADFTAMLTDLSIDRVVFDTHSLHAMKTEDEEIRDAQRRKPKTPARFDASGPFPMLRYVGRPLAQENLDDLRHHAAVVAGWIEQGRRPFVFLHQAPDDDGAPLLARLFHAELEKLLPGLNPMPPWPGEEEAREPDQLSLF